MVRSRVYGDLAGSGDQNDRDTLRAAPVFKLVADRSPNDENLAMDRPSDQRFVTHFFRLSLHAAAMKLLLRLRRFVVETLPALAPQVDTLSPTSEPG